ncbi:MAG: lipid A deacylase LpxR family protein [Elioraea sp.]|nr:lipid A deacylase LpxR family protein [Elioraea sp.]
MLAAGLALAQPCQAGARDPISNLTITYENDQFGGRDRYYTTGWQVAWRATSPMLTDLLVRATPVVSPWLPTDGLVRWGFGLGQNIYTPEDTRSRVPGLTDRPYAGWLYGSAALSAVTATSLALVELQFGVVGPSALGEQVQNNVHRILAIERSAGWSTQLKDEPGVNLILNRQWRVSRPFDPANPTGLGWSVVPSVAASLGNVQTWAGAGAIVKVGKKLDADFGPQRLRPAAVGSAFFRHDGEWGWYLLAGLEVRAIAHDIFLDGNTWRDSRSVDKKPLVGDGILGAVLILPRARLTYTHTFRSLEFDGQDNRLVQFGSISLSVPF